MDRRLFLKMTGIAGTGLMLGLPCGADAAVPMRETRVMLGTFVDVTVANVPAVQAEEAIGKAFGECARLDGIFSRYDSGSPVSELNRAGCLFDTPVELCDVMRKSVEMHHVTHGAFNVTVKPVVDYLDAHKNPSGRMRFDRTEFSELCALADADALHVEGRRISFGRLGMGVTLDGIAKGYIADMMADALRMCGVVDFVVNAGGDIRTGGAKAGGAPWRVAVQDPADRGARLAVVPMHDGAIATSGGYEHAFDASGEHTHLIHPASGQSPLTIAGVTVRAATTMEADALATAFSVVGAPTAIAMADRLPECACLVVLKDGTQLASRRWHA